MAIAGVVILIALYVIVFSFSYIRKSPIGSIVARTSIFFISPIQQGLTSSVRFVDNIWEHYFYLISTAKQNEILKKELSLAHQKENEYKEIALSNARLRRLVKLAEHASFDLVAAEIIGEDPSPWYQTIIINKGTADGIDTGSPVIVPDGVVGQVITATSGYAKVLLITDRNSFVDAIVQKSRTRGIVQGLSNGKCRLYYALRKLDVKLKDTIVTTGLDGVYPKGLRIGRVAKIVRRNSGLFQDVELIPFADFEKLEEVMVILNLQPHDFEES